MKKMAVPLGLAAIYAVLIVVAVPSGHVFGSHIDWLCQHVVLAETIRDACLAQHTLLPDWLELGSGSNGYQFAYYGYLRPDVLLGCLLPQLSMDVLVIGYLLVLGLVSALLLYVWLLAECGRRDVAWMAAVLFITAGCMFHLHRQVMFVNYFPFLLLTLLCLKRGKGKWVPLCLLGVCLSSFYYAPAVFVVVAWYWYRLEGSGFWKKWLPTVVLTTGMAAALLIPTGLVLMEHRSSQGGQTGLAELLMPNWDMAALLYDKYGMGLSMIVLYAMLAALRIKSLRKDAIFYFLVILFPLASYLLNGTLYARYKILMPFVPLLLLLAAKYFASTHSDGGCERSPLKALWPFLVIVPLVLPWHDHHAYGRWTMVDVGLLLAVVVLHQRWQIHKYLIMFLLLIAPLGLYFANAATEDWVPRAELEAAKAGIGAETLQAAQLDDKARVDSLLQPLNKANALQQPYSRSSMYSSVTNQDYADFCYKTLLAPIQINNRVALLTADDPFLFHLLGTRYVETTADKVPNGYQIIDQEGNWVLAENKSVLPRVYVTDDVVSQNAFEKLDDYAKLDVLARKTVVEGGAQASEIEAGMAAFSPAMSLPADLPEGLTIERTSQGWLVEAEKSCQLVINMDHSPSDAMLLCAFDVENLTRQAVVIEINGIRNMLSGASAPYPNNNTCFHYKFFPSAAGRVEQLVIRFSQGKYRINHVQWHAYQPAHFAEKQVTPLVLESGASIADTQVEVDRKSVLATTIPYQKGLRIIVDGRDAAIMRVNTAFAGTWLSPGAHSIQIEFSPPGKKAGMAVSVLSILLYMVFLIKRRRKYKDIESKYS